MAIGGGTGALARIDGGGGGSARLQIDEGVPSGGMRPVDERGKDIGLETLGARFARIAHARFSMEFLGIRNPSHEVKSSQVKSSQVNSIQIDLT